MSEIYACAHATDKKHVTGILLSGSAKRMMSAGEYFGMPTALASQDGDTLVTDPEAIKSVTRYYWSKLYMQKNTPNVPKPWLSTPWL